MKRKLLSIILCAVMIFSLGANAFAAEDSELTNVVKIAKSRLAIPAEFTEFYSNGNNAVGQKTYTLSWSTEEDDKRINVSILSSGEILSYNYIDYERDYNEKGFAPFSKEEYFNRAKVWIEKVNPTYVPEISKEYEVYIGGVYSGSVTVYFDREKDGIPVDGNYINVELDKFTGEIITMHSEWSKTASVADSANVIGVDAAGEILTEKAELRLRYYKLRDEDRAVLMYAPQKTYMMIDAATGNDFKVEYIDGEVEEGKTSGAGGGVAEAPSMDNATNESLKAELTEKEIAGVNEFEKLLSKAALTEIIRKMANTEVASMDVKTVNYRRVEKNEKTSYVATVGLAKDANKSGTVTIDAETGELLSFSTYLPYNKDKKKQKTHEQMQSNAVMFIKTWASDIADKAKNFSEERDSEYFYFTHNENDIEYEGNRINIRVDSETGKILSYSKNWNKDITFDSPEGIISLEEACGKFIEAAPAKLLYIANKRIRYASNNAEELALIYKLPDNAPRYIDAKTGEAYDYNMGQPQEATPEKYVLQSDLAGHWAEDIVKTLAENGIVISYEESFRPDEAITQKEIAVLIDCFNGGYRPYVIAENEYDTYIERLIRQNVIKKEEKNPDKKITREETVTYLVRMFGFGEVAEISGIFKTGFSDEADISANKIGYVAIAKGIGLASGNGGKFHPKNNVTRAELAMMLYNAMTK